MIQIEFSLYRFLPYKTDWVFAFDHLAYEYLKGNFFDSDRILYENFGLRVNSSRPISRFSRVDGGIDLNHIVSSEIVLLDSDNNGYLDIKDINYINSFTTLIPSLGYTWDNTLWSYTYPIEGFRYYINYKSSLGLNNTSLSFNSATMDGRKYFSLFNGISFSNIR